MYNINDRWPGQAACYSLLDEIDTDHPIGQLAVSNVVMVCERDKILSCFVGDRTIRSHRFVLNWFLCLWNGEPIFEFISTGSRIMRLHRTKHGKKNGFASHGATFAKIVHGCACRTLKIWLSLHQFLSNYPPISISFSIEKHTILPKLGGFYNICSKYTQFLNLGSFTSDNKAVLKPRVSPAFAITYFCNHCYNRFDPISVKTWKVIDP